MTDTVNTPKVNDCLTIRRKVGEAIYIARVHFSKITRETMEDKIKRMLREEARKM